MNKDSIPGHLMAEALDALSDGVAIFDAKRRLVRANARYREMLAPVADMLEPGAGWEDILQAARHRGIFADEGGADQEWQANLGSTGGGSALIRQNDGTTHEVAYEPLESGGFVVTRKALSEERSERLDLLEHVLAHCPTSVVMADAKTSELIYRTPSYVELHGDRTHAKDHYVDPAERTRFAKKVLRDGRLDGFRANIIEADGAQRDMAISGRLATFEGRDVIVSTATDLNRHLEDAHLLRSVLEAFPAPVLMTEAKSGRILFKSPEIDALFGENANTRSFYFNPADRQGFLDALRPDGIVHEYRARMRNAAGDPFWCAVSARLIEFEGREVIVSYSRDITGDLETQDELTLQRDQIFQNEKMTALGSLLAGVAHELNNPLSVVVGHSLMLRDASDDPEITRQTAKISEAAERCARIVKTFLAMARQKPVQKTKSDVNAIVTTALDVARFADGAGAVELIADLDPAAGSLMLDADQMTQVIINLVLNAEAAIVGTGKGRRVTVTTEASKAGLSISVQDDGPGVPEAIRSRIFEPFFTTKEVGEGTGIGLSFSHRVVHAHGGTLRLDSKTKDGARFVIQMPIEASAPTTMAPQPQVKSAGQARVLVIDDEVDVADLNAEMLKRAGYDVTVAYDGQSGLALLQKHSFDAVLSDLNMPGVDGRAFFDAIGQTAPDLLARTGFITGDTMGRASQGFLKEAGRPYLEKPVSPSELRDFVADLLNEERTS